LLGNLAFSRRHFWQNDPDTLAFFEAMLHIIGLFDTKAKESQVILNEDATFNMFPHEFVWGSLDIGQTFSLLQQRIGALEKGDDGEKDLAKMLTLIKGLFLVSTQVLAWEEFFAKIYPQIIDKTAVNSDKLGKDWVQIMNKSIESIN
jgi:hypothetical protein